MGTYNVGKKEIVEAVAKALDSIEGDFNKQVLIWALEKCKEYPYITDGTKTAEKLWNKYLYSE